jgi:flagellar hook-associated protein 2
MATLQLSGLASGFDWKSFVDQVMQTERAPINRLNAEKTANTNKISVFDTLSTRITDLQNAAKALRGDGLFNGRSAKSLTANSSWSASASASTEPGTYAIAVSQLATATKRVGTSDIGQGIAATNDVTGVTLSSMATATAVTAGVFTVNGSQVTIALTDSLQDVFDKISTATGGNVTASYDSTSDRITLSSGAAITLGAANDTSNFLAVTKLANNGTGTITSNASLGATKVSAALSSARLRSSITAVDGSGNGSFTINGVAISYNVNSDSLSAVLARINSSSAGVTATYDSAADKVTFSNKTTGNVGISFSEAAGGLLDAIGITGGSTTAGNNAQFTVNGGPTLTSTSNTLDATSHGITGLSVTVNSQTTESISVAADTAAMRKSIEDFVTKFNSVQSYIEDQSKVTTSNNKVTAALLANNREVQSWSSTFRTKAFEEVSGLSGTIKRLEHLGIDFASGTGTTQLVIKDSAKLDAALRDKPAEVESFFKTASTGFVAKLESFTTTILGTGTSSTGLINSQKNTLLTQNTGIDRQIADIERRLIQERSKLEAGFIAMERAQSTIQQMQQQLAQAFNTKK